MPLLQIFETTIFLSLLIFFHEFGHFLAAKIFGVPVEEFGFGYPPRALGKRIGETLYSLNLIPFGGFCKFQREGFSSRSKRRRGLIIFSGVLANFVLGWLFLSFLFAIGNPVLKNLEVEVIEVDQGSPAEKAGISEGDAILSIAGTTVETPDELFEETRNYLGQEVELNVRMHKCAKAQEECLRKVKLVPRETPPVGEGAMGIVMGLSGEESLEKTPILTAPLRGFSESARILGEMVLGVGEMLKKLVLEFRAPRELAGPVGIYQMTAIASKLGFRYLIQFVAFLSLNLSLLNLFPIPALDGGQLLFIAIETVRGKKISDEVEQLVNAAGMAFLALLAILLTIQDVKRLL